MIDKNIAKRIVLSVLHELSDTASTDLDSTLESVGLITVADRSAFSHSVSVEVGNCGHRIVENKIPIESSTTLGEIVDAVSRHTLPGTPTTGDDSV